jgi:hypothetical protein
MLTENNLRRIVREIIIENESSFHPELGKYLTKGLERAYDIERGLKKGGSYKKSGSGKENPKIEDLLFNTGKLSELKPENNYSESNVEKNIALLKLSNTSKEKIYKDFFINLYRFLSNKDDYDFSQIEKIYKNNLELDFENNDFYKDYKQRVKSFDRNRDKSVTPDFAKYIIKLFED